MWPTMGLFTQAAVEKKAPQPITLTLDDTPVEIVHAVKRKQAVGRFRNGVITVTVPSAWPQAEQVKASLSLAKRLLRDYQKTQQLARQARQTQPCITLTTDEELTQFVDEVNNDTFQAELNGVQFGRAKYSRLAQINLRNHVMTISPYCTQQVPLEALRYLVIHELAHTLEANHSPRFWAQVARFCPDWQHQSAVIKAIHQVNQG